MAALAILRLRAEIFARFIQIVGYMAAPHCRFPRSGVEATTN